MNLDFGIFDEVAKTVAAQTDSTVTDATKWVWVQKSYGKELKYFWIIIKTLVEYSWISIP